MEQVSWKDVKGYIRKLNELSGLKGCERRASRFPLHKRGCYRLPTEAEWEGFAHFIRSHPFESLLSNKMAEREGFEPSVRF